MLWKCCSQYVSKFGKLSSGHRTGEGQFSFQSQRKAMPKNAQTIAQLHSFHMLVKQCPKFSKPGFNSMWTMNFQMFKLVLRKGRGTRDQIANICWIIKKAREFQKTSTSALLTMPKPLTVCITTNCGKFWKRWEYQTTWPASWEIWMQVRKQQLELDMEQQTGSKSGKEYVKAVCCHFTYLTSIQSTSWEMVGWIEHKLESRLPGEISITSDMQVTPPLWQKAKKYRASWWKWKRRVKKLA